MSSGFAAPRSWGIFGGTMATAAAAGTVSQATGGKFANGAITGAFIHLFNAGSSSLLAYGEKVYDTVRNYFSMKDNANRLNVGLALDKIYKDGIYSFEMQLKDRSNPNYFLIYQKESDYDGAMTQLIHKYAIDGEIDLKLLDY